MYPLNSKSHGLCGPKARSPDIEYKSLRSCQGKQSFFLRAEDSAMIFQMLIWEITHVLHSGAYTYILKKS